MTHRIARSPRRLAMHTVTNREKSVVHVTGTFRTRDDTLLFEQRWTAASADRSSVVIVHGLAEHSGRYGHVAAHLVRQGHAVYTYDLRGHGRSEGRRGFVRRFDDYVDDLDMFIDRVRTDRPAAPLYLLAQSMGATISALLGIERQGRVDGLVLASPMIRMGNSVPRILQRLSSILGLLLPGVRTMGVDRNLISRDAAVVEEARKDPLNYHGRVLARFGAEFVRAGERIRARMEDLSLPLLIIHGTADRLTDPAGSEELFCRSRSQDKTLSLFRDLYHETMNEPEKERVLDMISDWLEERSA
jgi:acylglycerol lipase